MGKAGMSQKDTRTTGARVGLFLVVVLLAPGGSRASIDLLGRTTATFTWSYSDGDVTEYKVYVACGQGEAPADFDSNPTLKIPVELPNVKITAGFGTQCKIRVSADDRYGRISAQSIESDVIHFIEPAEAENDFDGDGISDIIVQDQYDGRALLLSGRDIRTGSEFLYLRTTINTSDNLNWEIVDTGDFNGDGIPEFLWYAVTGHVGSDITTYTYTYVVGTDIDNTTVVLNGVTDSEEIIAVADFNGDGADDILYRTNDHYGSVYVTFLGPEGVVGTSRYEDMLRDQFDFIACGDFDADGNDDVMWRQRETGQVIIWMMIRPGTADIANSGVLTDVYWQGETAGNFNNSVEEDVLWRNIETGETRIWYMDDLNEPTEYDLNDIKLSNWTLLATGDLNGDGRADLTWFDADTNLLEVWRMDENLENGFSIE